ncbi:MAG: ABC transporter permease [Chloroflexi bacterium]|nr:ABC transporter permease [Chloroflexota bacterium]
MGRYIMGRAVQGLTSMFLVTIFVFGIVRLSGDPLQMLLPEEAPPEQYAEMKKLLYLDKPIVVQYWKWISRVVRGDLGTSTKLRIPVMELIGERLPNTLQLAAVAFAFTLTLGLAVGVYAAAWRGSVVDYVARGFAVMGQAAPSFWSGIIFILIFAVYLRWLPAGGKGGLSSIILPAFTLGWLPVAGVMRMTRSSMLEVLNSEYIKLARIKGVRETLVLWKHGFKNAALPVLTYTALIFIAMINGSVIIETVFAWPGIGRLVLEAVLNRDFPIVQAVVLMFSTWYILGNLFIDIGYAYLNPRIRY